MKYTIFTKENVNDIIPLYIHYYNEKEEGEWTEDTVYKRICQMISREDSFGLLMRDKDRIIGFALGYFEQYDDGITYTLIEIVIADEYQSQGYGTKLVNELERQVKNMGAFQINLLSVNDDNHDRFYGRLGFKNATNLVLKVKTIAEN